MKTTPKKKLSAYNRHVRAFSKTYKGNPKNMMKAAARSWKGKRTGASKKPRSPRKTTKRRKNIVKKKKSRSSGFRLPGGLGPKGILTGIIGLSLIPRVVPVTTPGQAKLATGLALRALKLGGGGALSSVGIMEVAAEMLGGQLGQILPGGNGGAVQRYDY